MYEIQLSFDLEKILVKIKRKDKKLFRTIKKKMLQIVTSNPQHYKNLRYGMKEFKRVHVNSSFVLIFKINEQQRTIHFETLKHHDKIYK